MWILDQALSNYVNSKFFLNGCFQVLEVFKKLVTIIFKMMLIKMGPSNEDIWILDFGILDVALNNGNLFGQW
jgi:hypothetical protein